MIYFKYLKEGTNARFETQDLFQGWTTLTSLTIILIFSPLSVSLVEDSEVLKKHLNKPYFFLYLIKLWNLIGLSNVYSQNT